MKTLVISVLIFLFAQWAFGQTQTCKESDPVLLSNTLLLEALNSQRISFGDVTGFQSQNIKAIQIGRSMAIFANCSSGGWISSGEFSVRFNEEGRECLQNFLVRKEFNPYKVSENRVKVTPSEKLCSQ